MRCKINLVWFLAHFEPPVKGFSYYLTLEKKSHAQIQQIHRKHPTTWIHYLRARK